MDHVCSSGTFKRLDAKPCSPFVARVAKVDSLGKPRPRTPLISFVNVTFVELTRPGSKLASRNFVIL